VNKPARLLIQIVLLLLINLTQALAASESGQRLSLSISGGASLGAYEAGINWALLTLMRYQVQYDQRVSRD